MTRRKALALLAALAFIVPSGLSWSSTQASTAKPEVFHYWPASVTSHGVGPKSPLQFFAAHVKAMRLRHPGAVFETTGYSYVSDPQSGQLITGIQTRIAGASIFHPCWFYAVWDPSNQSTAGSCRGN